MPAASAIWASRIFSSKVFCQRSGTVVAARPLEQLEPKTASLNRLPPNMVGLRSTSIEAPQEPCHIAGTCSSAQQPAPIHINGRAGHKVVFDQKHDSRCDFVGRAWTRNQMVGRGPGQ